MMLWCQRGVTVDEGRQDSGLEKIEKSEEEEVQRESLSIALAVLKMMKASRGLRCETS